MTDQPLSDDELLSSHLDGELDAAERDRLEARLDRDPALRRRLADLRESAAIAATPVDPLDAAAADRMIAAALAASATAANVSDLDTARGRRRFTPARVATVAAGVIALAITVPALRAIDSDDGDFASTSAEVDAAIDAAGAGGSDADDTDTPLEAAEMAPDATAAADATMQGDTATEITGAATNSLLDVLAYSRDPSFDPLGDALGEFDTTDALSARVVESWTGYAAEPDATGPSDTVPASSPEGDSDEQLRALAASVSACADLDRAAIDDVRFDADVLAADFASADVAGSPVAVGLFRLPGDQTLAFVIDLTTCAVTDITLD